MQVKMQFITRQIAGEYVLVPTGEAALKLNGLVTVNEVGAFLWERLPDAENEEQLVDAVTATYDVEREEAAADVEMFLQKLRELGAL